MDKLDENAQNKLLVEILLSETTKNTNTRPQNNLCWPNGCDNCSNQYRNVEQFNTASHDLFVRNGIAIRAIQFRSECDGGLRKTYLITPAHTSHQTDVGSSDIC